MSLESEGGFSILVVDDNPVNTRLLETILVREGYAVLTAEDGPTARELAFRYRPALILLDIRMDREDGFHVIRQLKLKAETATIPVIFLTSVSEIDAKIKGFDLGAVDYILKPFHPKEVLARVRLHLKLSVATNSLIRAQAEKLRQLSRAQTELLIRPEELPAARFGVLYDSFQEAGGDFYDVLPISEDVHGYFVADFSGHDISTSYLTAAIKALLKQNCQPLYQPAESMRLINDVLITFLPEGKYLTACYAHLNRRTNTLTLVSAGHLPAIWMPIGSEPEAIALEGDILGMFDEVLFGTTSLKVSPGDRLLLFSDGLVESVEKRAVWTSGIARVRDACHDTRICSIEETPEAIRNRLRPSSTPADDDIVVLAIEV